jgi:hypothetical protein
MLCNIKESCRQKPSCYNYRYIYEPEAQKKLPSANPLLLSLPTGDKSQYRLHNYN